MSLAVTLMLQKFCVSFIMQISRPRQICENYGSWIFNTQ